VTAVGAARPILIVADDLTGACDTAGAVSPWVGPVPVHIGAPNAGAVVTTAAIDLDARAGTAERAVDLTVAAVSSALGRGVDVYLKIDSTLRGHVLATVVAAAERFRATHPAGRVVVCPAFPARDRIVRGGRVHADGVAVGATALHDLAALGWIDVLDALDDAHLAAIAASAGDDPVLWVGSAGLAPHVVRARVEGFVPKPAARPAPAGSVVVVVGSDQAPNAGGVAELAERADSRVRVIVGDPRRPAVIAAASTACAGADALVVTGGFTARRLFERLGVDTLIVRGEVEPGIPWSTMVGRDGVVVTKAGGFGGTGALGRAVDFLLDPA
jgi:uncharacterized protein YgbK (DUF1537 family)